jgi:molybdate transport system ATP-binding protein
MIKISLQQAFDDFSLDLDVELPDRGISVIFGHSGSGKTSLLRCLAGFETAAGACVEFRGQRWQQGPYHLPSHRRKLAYVFQEASLFEHLNVRGNLDYASKRAGSERYFDELELVRLLDLESLLEQYPQTLSGGERQRVAIARALFSQPRLLLMDEALVSLDYQRKQAILTYLEGLRECIPIIYVTHSSDEVIRLADHLLVLDQGRVFAQGELETVLADQKVLANMSHEPFSVLFGELVRDQNEALLSLIDIGQGQILRLPKSTFASQRLRLRLNAKDISLNLERPSNSSILNILACTVIKINPPNQAGQQVILLRLDCGAQIQATITAYSCLHLGLVENTRLYAQIKAVSVLS